MSGFKSLPQQEEGDAGEPAAAAATAVVAGEAQALISPTNGQFPGQHGVLPAPYLANAAVLADESPSLTSFSGAPLLLNLAVTGLYFTAAFCAFQDVYDTVTKVASVVLLLWIPVGRLLGVYLFSGGAGAQNQGPAFTSMMRNVLLRWQAAFALLASAYVVLTSTLAGVFASSESDTAFYISMAWGSLRMQLCLVLASVAEVILYRRHLRESHRGIPHGSHSTLYWVIPTTQILAAAALTFAVVRSANSLVAAPYTVSSGLVTDLHVNVSAFLPNTGRQEWVCEQHKAVLNFSTRQNLPRYTAEHPTVDFHLPVSSENSMYSPSKAWKGADIESTFIDQFTQWTKDEELLTARITMDEIGTRLCNFLDRPAISPLAKKLGANGLIATIMPLQNLAQGANLPHALGCCLVKRVWNVYKFDRLDFEHHQGTSFLSEIIFNQTEFTAPLFAPMHGALWTYLSLAKIDDPEEAWNVAHEGFCQTLIDQGVQQTAAYSGCIHGLGHGAWMSFKELRKALAVCTAAPSRDLGYNCATGVYHSLQQSGTGSPYVNSEIDVVAMAKTGEVFFPCSATPDVNDFLASCFFRYSKGYWKTIDMRQTGLAQRFHVSSSGADRSGVCESVQGPFDSIQGAISSRRDHPIKDAELLHQTEVRRALELEPSAVLRAWPRRNMANADAGVEEPQVAKSHTKVAKSQSHKQRSDGSRNSTVSVGFGEEGSVVANSISQAADVLDASSSEDGERTRRMSRALARRACAWSDSTLSSKKKPPRRGRGHGKSKGSTADTGQATETELMGAVCNGYRTNALLDFNRYFDWLACLVGLFQNGAVRYHEEVPRCSYLDQYSSLCQDITDLSDIIAGGNTAVSEKFQSMSDLSQYAFDVCLLAAKVQGTFMPEILDFFQE